MTRRLELPKFQAFDANGDPLSGGKVYTYSAGTTNLKTSYSDYDASTANANPVVLDSRGEADIYVKGLYKIAVYTSADVLVWTLDNVMGGAGGNAMEDYYYPDATATDQGATGNSDTIKYAVDTIGTDRGTIYLAHSSGSATTTYTLTTSETIPSNITLIKEPGAILDGAGTLTIEGQFECGLDQAFGSSITVTFGDSYIEGVYPQWWEEDFGDGSTDGAGALQSAINACVGSVAGHYKDVHFVPGNYSIESKVTLKSAGLIGVGGAVNSGVRILWNGTTGVTAFEKDSTAHEGSLSTFRVENINFRGDANNPDYWIDLSTVTGSVDSMVRFKDLQFVGTAKSPIKVGRWLNCHWEHLRFDNFGEYCIDFVIPSTPNMSTATFVLDGFTADAITQSALGFVHIDASANQISNMGTFELANGRIEINEDLDSTNPGIFVYKIPTSANSRTIGFKLRNVTFQDVSGCTVYVLYRDTTNTAAGETIILENFRQDGLEGLMGGSTTTSFNDITLPTNTGYLALNTNGSSVAGNAFDLSLFAPYGTNDAIWMQNKDDSEARVILDNNGYLKFGPGDDSVDTGLRRDATAGSGIYGLRVYESTTNSGVAIKNKTTELTAMSGATETWTSAIPVGVIVLGVTARVTTLITGATSFDVGVAGNTDRYIDGMDVALNTTGDLADSTGTSPNFYASATDIVVTAQGSDFTAGALRLTVHYIELEPATS